MLRLFQILFVIVSSLGTCLSATPAFDGVIRKGADGREEAYMITLFPSSHASFLEKLPNGNLAMAWFSGEKEGGNKTAIVFAELKKGSSKWEKAKVVSQRVDYSNQNPVLFYDNVTNILHLYHSQQPASPHINESFSQLWKLYSTDEGQTFSKPEILFSKYGSYDRNRIILSTTGAYIYPIYDARYSNSSVAISADHGATWTKYGVPSSNGLVQPTIFRVSGSPNTLLKAFFRDRRNQWIYVSQSTDEGQSWSDPVPTSLPNNNAGIQATVLQSGGLLLAFNDCNQGRKTISLGLSYDFGVTWKFIKQIEPEKTTEQSTKQSIKESIKQATKQATRQTTIKNSDGFGKDVEYSYPSVLQTEDGMIHVSYTYDRLTIKYIRVTEDWIKN